MKIKLVQDWKYAWKWFSTNMMVIATAIQGAWMYIPEDMKTNIPHNIVNILTMVLLGLGLVGRIVQQGDNKNAGDSDAS